MKVTIDLETEKLLKAIEADPNLKDNPLFIAGQKYAELRVDEQANIMSWNKPAVNELIFNLLMSSKIDVPQILAAYTSTIEKNNRDKQHLIADLTTKLISYRKKMYSPKELPEFEEKVDEVIRKTDLFNY